MDKAFWKELILKPLFRRIGTWAAAWLVFGGDWACTHWNACGLVTPGGAEQVAAYLVAVALLCFDLMLSWAERVAVKRKAATAVLRDRGIGL